MDNVFVCGNGWKMDFKRVKAGGDWLSSYSWYAEDGNVRRKLGSILESRMQVGKNASAAGEKIQAWASNSTSLPKFSKSSITVPSQFYRSMMKADEANNNKQPSVNWTIFAMRDAKKIGGQEYAAQHSF